MKYGHTLKFKPQDTQNIYFFKLGPKVNQTQNCNLKQFVAKRDLVREKKEAGRKLIFFSQIVLKTILNMVNKFC